MAMLVVVARSRPVRFVVPPGAAFAAIAPAPLVPQLPPPKLGPNKLAASKTALKVAGKSSGTNCGTGHGGFKPGNICGKGKRKVLADQLKALRAKAHAGQIDHATLRAHARMLRHHRRNHNGAIANAHAHEIRSAIRSGNLAGVAGTQHHKKGGPPVVAP